MNTGSERTEVNIRPWKDFVESTSGEYSFVTAITLANDSACPTVDHVRLLLTLLGATQPVETPHKGSRDDVVALPTPPGLIVLWDMGRMFMEQIEEDENLPPDAAAKESVGEWIFKPGYVVSDIIS